MSVGNLGPSDPTRSSTHESRNSKPQVSDLSAEPGVKNKVAHHHGGINDVSLHSLAGIGEQPGEQIDAQPARWCHGAWSHRGASGAELSCWCEFTNHLGGNHALRSGREPLDQHRLRRQCLRQLGVGDQRFDQHHHRHGLGGDPPPWSCRQPLDQHHLRHQPGR